MFVIQVGGHLNRFAAVWLLAAGLALAWASPIGAEPFIPATDHDVLERVRSTTDPAARELQNLRLGLGRDPGNLENALAIAKRYIAQGRAEADPRYFGYAQAALAPWWTLQPPPPDVLVLRAYIRQSNHDFTGALSDLDAALSVQPNNLQAWFTRAIILQVRGEYPAARASCRPLADAAGRAPELAFVAAMCANSVAGYHGEAIASYTALRNALQHAPRADDTVWALTVLAEMAARIGRNEAAQTHFTQALALGPRDTPLLTAYADFLLDRRRWREIIPLLKDETRVDGLLLRLALAEQALGTSTLAQHVEMLRARFAAGAQRNDLRHLREEARFTLSLLNQPREALTLALANWAVQREPEDARILLEAALAAQDPDRAEPVLRWLAESRLEDRHLAALSRRFRTPP